MSCNMKEKENQTVVRLAAHSRKKSMLQHSVRVSKAKNCTSCHKIIAAVNKKHMIFNQQKDTAQSTSKLASNKLSTLTGDRLNAIILANLTGDYNEASAKVAIMTRRTLNT